MKGAAPWYRQVPVIVPIVVSLLALGFAFYTNDKSENRASREEQHALRAELRSLIQRLSAFPRENFELYRKDPSAWRQLSGPIQRETLILARQSSELIHQLRSRVTSEEYIAVAFALSSAGQTAESEELTLEGLNAAKDATGEATLLRQLGTVRFADGDFEGGRKRFEQAMAIYKKYPEKNRNNVTFNSAFTQLNWSEAELGQRHCLEAWQHITSAKTYRSSIKTLIEATEKNVARTCGPRTPTRH
jgi:tetratricopeptide (TPR) repeat protein